MINVVINGAECTLATTLRVAYMVQGQHNHRPYSKVFAEMGDMPLEDQIGILYCAYKCGNNTFDMTRDTFLSYYLDNYTLKEVLDQLKKVIGGIMGEDLDAPKTEQTGAKSEGTEGN